jgi:hypothetical protein
MHPRFLGQLLVVHASNHVLVCQKKSQILAMNLDTYVSRFIAMIGLFFFWTEGVNSMKYLHEQS